MNRWLVDASVILAREDTDDVHHADAGRLLAGPGVVATIDLALYEVTNVAVVAWKDAGAAARVREVIHAIADDGGLVRASGALLAEASRLALERGLSGYDAAYVAAAVTIGARLVSCDVRDLVSRGLALLPGHAVALERTQEPADNPGPRAPAP